jgi:hypothetical protein
VGWLARSDVGQDCSEDLAGQLDRPGSEVRQLRRLGRSGEGVVVGNAVLQILYRGNEIRERVGLRVRC